MTTIALSSPTPADMPRFDLGDIVHEVNNALAPILLSVEILRRRVSDPDALRHLDLVAGNAWRGAAAVRQILALTAPKPVERGLRGRPSRTDAAAQSQPANRPSRRPGALKETPARTALPTSVTGQLPKPVSGRRRP